MDYNVTREEFNRHKKCYDLYTSPLGKEVYKDMRQNYSDRDSFVPGDPHATCFMEGQRSIVLGIKRIIDGIEQNLFTITDEGG